MTTTQHENPPHVAHLVDAYVAGALDAESRRGVDDHVAACQMCAAALADALSADAVLSVALGTARPAAGFEDRVAAGVRAGIARRGWRRWAAPSSYPILGHPAVRHPLVRRIATGVAAAVVLGAVGYGASVGADREERAARGAETRRFASSTRPGILHQPPQTNPVVADGTPGGDLPPPMRADVAQQDIVAKQQAGYKSRQLYKEGAAAEGAGQFNDSLLKYQEALATDPENRDAIAGRDRILQNRGLNVNPDSPLGRSLDVARLQRQEVQANFDTAVEQRRAALERNDFRSADQATVRAEEAVRLQPGILSMSEAQTYNNEILRMRQEIQRKERDELARAEAESRPREAERIRREMVLAQQQRESRLDDLIGASRRLTNDSKYREAAGVVSQILLVDPKNDYALGVRGLLEDRADFFEQRKEREQLSAAGEKKVPYDNGMRYPADWPEISASRGQTAAQAGTTAANQPAEAGTVPNASDTLATAAAGKQHPGGQQPGGQQAGGQQRGEAVAFGRSPAGQANQSNSHYYADSAGRNPSNEYAIKPVAPDEVALGVTVTPGLQTADGNATNFYATNYSLRRGFVGVEADKKKLGEVATASTAQENGKRLEKESLALGHEPASKLAVRLDGTTVSGPQSADENGPTKAGAGTVTLNGGTTYAGSTAVSGGVVVADGKDASGPVAGTGFGYTSNQTEARAGKSVALKGIKENGDSPNFHDSPNFNLQPTTPVPGSIGSTANSLSTVNGTGVALNFEAPNYQWADQHGQGGAQGVGQTARVPDGGTVMLGGQRASGVVTEPAVSGPMATFGTPAGGGKGAGARPGDPAAPVARPVVATATPPKLDAGAAYKPEQAQAAAEVSALKDRVAKLADGDGQKEDLVRQLAASEAKAAQYAARVNDLEFTKASLLATNQRKDETVAQLDLAVERAKTVSNPTGGPTVADVKGKPADAKPGESKPAETASLARNGPPIDPSRVVEQGGAFDPAAQKSADDAVAKLTADRSVETLNKLVDEQRKVFDAAKEQQNPELAREIEAKKVAEAIATGRVLNVDPAAPLGRALSVERLEREEAEFNKRKAAETLRTKVAGVTVADARDTDGPKKPAGEEPAKPALTPPATDPRSGRETTGDGPVKVPEATPLQAPGGDATPPPAPPPTPAPAPAPLPPQVVKPPVTPPVGPQPAQPIRRMVIRNGEVVFEVDSFDGAVNTITKIAAEEGGVVTTTTSDKLPNGKVSGSVTVRCPPERLDTLVLKLRGIGDLKSQQLAAQDVTKQYTDISAQLRAATTMEQRLLDIIKAGGAVKDLLEAEKQLGVWRQRVEQLQGEINYYDNLVANSTLVITLNERDVRSPTAAYETEQVQAGIEADDVEKARADALAAIDKVKGRVVDSDLQKLQGDQFQATIVADVAPDRAGEVIDRLKQLGRVSRMEASRKTVTTGGPGPIVAGLKVERRETRLQVSIYNLARVAPRQNTTLSVAAADVEAAYNNVLKQAAAANGRVVTSKLERPRPDQVVGAVRIEIPTAQADAVLTAIRAGVDVMRMNVVVNPDAANTTEAKRGIDIEVRSLSDVPAREQTTLQVYSGTVPAAFAKLVEAAKAGGGRVYASQLNEQDPNNLQGTLEFDVPREKWSPIDAALKEAGLTVSRNVTRSNDAENTVDSKIRLRVELFDEIRLTPRESVAAIVSTATVQEAFYALTDAAKAAGARAVSSTLNVNDRTNPTGEVVFSVAREQSAAFETALKSAGFLVSRTTARQPDGPTTVENRVGYRVSVIDEERLTPREAIDARVAVPAVSEAFAALLDAAKAAGARTIGSSLNLADRSNPTGTLMFSVAREKSAAFETALRGAGLLVSRTANRQQDGVTTVDNRVGFRVTVIDEGKLIARETVRTRVASRTVGETYRRLVAAAQKAGARVVRSDLNENDLLRPAGSITFAIDRQAANEFESAMAKDKDALVVTRNTERRAEQQDVVEQKVGYDVTVVAERTLTPREVRSMVVVAPSARDRYAKALETAVAADAYVLTSQLVREGESGVYGELDLVIERRRLPELEAALTAGADVFGRDVARSADPSAADHLIRVRTIIRDADRQSPRETYDLTVATPDVDKAAGDLETLAASVGGRKVDGQRRTNDQGQDEAVLVLNVPLRREADVLNAARSADNRVTQMSSTRDDRVPEGALSRATVKITLQAAPKVGASRGLGENLREGVNTGLNGLVVGLKYIIMGLLLVVPVLLVAWVAVRLFRGNKRRPVVVTPPAGGPPSTGGPTPTPA